MDHYNESAQAFYAFRNDLWKVGHELMESRSRKDQRFGQFMVELGYLVGNHYQNKPQVHDDTWRESMRESMRESARFAQVVKLD